MTDPKQMSDEELANRLAAYAVALKAHGDERTMEGSLCDLAARRLRSGVAGRVPEGLIDEVQWHYECLHTYTTSADGYDVVLCDECEQLLVSDGRTVIQHKGGCKVLLWEWLLNTLRGHPTIEAAVDDASRKAMGE